MKSLIICANVLLFIVASALMWVALHTFYKTTALLSPEAFVIFACIQIPFFLFVLSAFSLYFSIQKYGRGKTDKKFKEFFPVYFKSVRLSIVLFLGLVITSQLKSAPEISLHNIKELSLWGWSVGIYAILLAYICPDLKKIFMTRKEISAETAYPKYIRSRRLTRWSLLALSLTLIYWSGIFTLAFLAKIQAFDSEKGLLPFWCGAMWVITLLIAPGSLMVWASYIKIGSHYLDQFPLFKKNNVILFENVTDIIYETMEVRISAGLWRTYYNFRFTFKDGSITKRSYVEWTGARVLEELKLHKQLNVHEGHVAPERRRKLIIFLNYLPAYLAAALIIFKICEILSE